jgi:hypothetical protein
MKAIVQSVVLLLPGTTVEVDGRVVVEEGVLKL